MNPKVTTLGSDVPATESNINFQRLLKEICPSPKKKEKPFNLRVTTHSQTETKTLRALRKDSGRQMEIRLKTQDGSL